ncbi:hypothetical protein GCM10007913_20260 [Devosia yakushimensis]|uniref:Uncharacterized protein n=1 Tax=Devosia yakushimensis TaxID=470028 RepID=A0ABQ5UE16_9HYPH|nr:hypothetical protein [Devosia yakushimensis]GLQ10094.1 hypothetical protein GCM10007913_20260 [Devosia yakushimensis]
MLRVKHHRQIVTKNSGTRQEFDLAATASADNMEVIHLVAEAIESVRPCREDLKHNGDYTKENVPGYFKLHLTSGEELNVNAETAKAIVANLGVSL